MVQLWWFIMYNCSTGEGSTKDETNLESLPVKAHKKQCLDNLSSQKQNCFNFCQKKLMNGNLLPRQDVLKPHTEQVSQLVFSWNKLLLLGSDFLFPISHDNEEKHFHSTEFN